ncbi:tetratricopeptide repeat protein, partial [Sandarakinorhabdus sp. AAP62]|uniref:tetratricopeptide repeat protein n=1 Tax=Sandarakinorhabdus sp. AAP62 TaxID=1248916 RepID=UPI000475BF5E
ARQQRYKEAEAAYLRSIEIGKALRDDGILAQVYRNYALLLQKTDVDEAMRYLEESLRLNKRQNDRRGIEIVQRSVEKLQARRQKQQSLRPALPNVAIGESDHGATEAPKPAGSEEES